MFVFHSMILFPSPHRLHYLLWWHYHDRWCHHNVLHCQPYRQPRHAVTSLCRLPTQSDPDIFTSRHQNIPPPCYACLCRARFLSPAAAMSCHILVRPDLLHGINFLLCIFLAGQADVTDLEQCKTLISWSCWHGTAIGLLKGSKLPACVPHSCYLNFRDRTLQPHLL